MGVGDRRARLPVGVGVGGGGAALPPPPPLPPPAVQEKGQAGSGFKARCSWPSSCVAQPTPSQNQLGTQPPPLPLPCLEQRQACPRPLTAPEAGKRQTGPPTSPNVEMKAEMDTGSSGCAPQYGKPQASELKIGTAADVPHSAARPVLKLEADDMAPTQAALAELRTEETACSPCLPAPQQRKK